MKTREFLDILRRELGTLPQIELQKQLTYYEEILNDMVEDGMSEEEATAKIGDPKEVAAFILKDMPAPPRPVLPPRKANIKKVSFWMVLALILGSPIWISLIVAAVAVGIAVVAAVLAVVIALFALIVGLVFGGIGLICAPFLMVGATAPVVVLTIGTGFVAIGLGMLTWLLLV